MSDRRRLVMVVPRFPVPSETFIAGKFAGLLARGWDVHIVCGEEVAAGWTHHEPVLDWAAMRSRVHAVPAARPRWLVPLRAAGTLLHALARSPRGALRYLVHRLRERGLVGLRSAYDGLTVVRLRPDVIHFEFGALAPSRMVLGEALDRPTTVSFRGYDICYSHLGVPGFYDPVWRGAARIHVLGQDLWARALARGCPASMPHARIAPAVDAARFQSARAAESPASDDRTLRLVSIGRLHWKKGHEYGLRAVSRLRAMGIPVHWTIVGDGPQRPAIAYGVHALGLGDAVSLEGLVAPDVVRAHLARADVFFHPAISEGFCNAVLEAQAMGLPVVATDAEGLRENVEDGVTGRIVARRDPAALATAVAELARDTALRGAMAAAGPERVARLFSWSDHLDRWEAFYGAVLSGREASA